MSTINFVLVSSKNTVKIDVNALFSQQEKLDWEPRFNLLFVGGRRIGTKMFSVIFCLLNI